MKFIEIEGVNGEIFAINIDNIVIVKALSKDNTTRIAFVDGSSADVKKSFEEVLLKINMYGGD